MNKKQYKEKLRKITFNKPKEKRTTEELKKIILPLDIKDFYQKLEDGA